MFRAIIAAFFYLVTSIYAINRPVYKIVLTQKGYAQFLQYDVETPPLREFTFCTWIRVYDLGTDQTIFSYVANGNNRVLRLWLDSGGRYIKVSINAQLTSNMRVDVVKDVWRHVCLSYQSDFGAWALYVDSRLVSCEAAQSLHGFVLPGGGSVIIGYGTADNGGSNGFEGEIFGANMILSSTIERNFTMKKDPLFEQKHFSKNKLKKDSKYTNYVILSDLETGKIHNNFEKNNKPPINSSKNYIRLTTPHSFVEHNVGVDKITTKPYMKDISVSQEILDLTVSDFKTINKDKIDFWNLESAGKPRFTENSKTQVTIPPMSELLNTETRTLPMVSEYETPPPPPPTFYFDKTLVMKDQPTPTESIYKLKNRTIKSGKTMYRHLPVTELSDIETPPPEEEVTKVYGQWTSSKFAGTVLNYLKSINFKNREQIIRKVPQTIPLHKVSDSHPYSSDFKLNILRPPSKFKRRKVVEKWYDIVKRDPQINVQILEEDLRSNILKTHAETRPKKVEITNRGETKRPRERRFYRNAHYEKKIDEEPSSLEDIYHPKPFTLTKDKKTNHRYFAQPTLSNPHTSVLPFLKSLDYTMLDSENTETQTVSNSKDMYSRSLSQANKWHNVKSYSNDYTPRKVNIDSAETEIDTRKQYPVIRLNYVHENRKKLEEKDPDILNGRKLAIEVSNQSTVNHDTVSILKYNHGYLPNQYEKTKFNPLRNRVPSKRNMDATNFDKHVKIGNALNERNVLGDNEEQKKQSFVGGNENVPDINRYRSDIDSENVGVPPSLGPRVCKNVELYDRVLYVQQDESIDMTHILSPMREKNIAIEFIMQNYKKCSLTESSLQNNAMLFIDWSKTPVRLFGGAYPKTTTDLCGFF